MPEQASTNTQTARPNTRQALLDAAEALFSERGYEAVGIREIVERADANLAAIKYHFGSKRDLYNETVRRILDRARVGGNIWDLLVGPFSQPTDAVTALGMFVGRHCLRVLEGGPSTVAARLFLIEAIWPSEAFDDVIAEHFKPCTERLEAVIRQINPEINDSEASTLANSVMAPMAYQRVYRKIIESMEPNRQPIDEHAVELAESISSFVVRGIGGSEQMCEIVRTASRQAIRSAIRQSGQTPGTENQQA